MDLRLHMPSPGRGRGRGGSVVVSMKPTVTVVDPGLHKAVGYTVQHLRQPLHPLHSLTKKTFVVTGSYSHKKVHIVPAHTRQLATLKLNDTIATEVRDLPYLNLPPMIGHVVLAENIANQLFMRVEVTEYYNTGPNTGKACVRCVDTGRSYRYDITLLKHVNDKIMDIPVIGYGVTLAEIPDFAPKIFPADFAKFINKIRQEKTEYKVHVNADGSFSHMTGVHSKKSLASEILNLGKWQWERIALKSTPFERTDDAIFAAGNWEKYPTALVPNPGPLPWTDYFCAEVVRDAGFESLVGANGKKLDYVSIFIKPLTPEWGNLKFTLDAQVAEYMNMVKPSPFFPAQNEMVFVRFPDSIPGENSRKLHRMLRIDVVTNAYFDVDRGRIYRIDPEVEGYEFRKILPDFVRIPLFTLEGTILELEKDNPKHVDFVKNNFKAKKRFHFQIVKADQIYDDGLTVLRCFELMSYLLR